MHFQKCYKKLSWPGPRSPQLFCWMLSKCDATKKISFEKIIRKILGFQQMNGLTNEKYWNCNQVWASRQVDPSQERVSHRNFMALICLLDGRWCFCFYMTNKINTSLTLFPFPNNMLAPNYLRDIQRNDVSQRQSWCHWVWSVWPSPAW